jgi:RNA polymerase sigma factor (sigma-70 family)
MSLIFAETFITILEMSCHCSFWPVTLFFKEVMEMNRPMRAHPEIPDQAKQSLCEAFEQIVRDESVALLHFVSRYVNDADVASDICQQVFIQLYLFLPVLHRDRPLTPWLFHVARNYCIDEARRKHAIHFSELEGEGWRRSDEEDVSLLQMLPDPCPLPDEMTEQGELQRQVREAISALPPKFRAVVSLRYAADLSYAEIGARLHIPPATAKTYFQRAKPLLRKLLIRQGVVAA